MESAAKCGAPASPEGYNAYLCGLFLLAAVPPIPGTLPCMAAKWLLPSGENDMLANSVFPLSETRYETSPVVEGGFGRGCGAIDLSPALGGRRTTEEAESSLLYSEAQASCTPSLTAVATR